jgi:Tfp pilus tip-associated adhesin PilY1
MFSMKNKYSILAAALMAISLSSSYSYAQIVYANDTDGNVWRINMNGCNTSLVVNMPVFNDMAISASGIVTASLATACTCTIR